jgi:hypothetical protein
MIASSPSLSDRPFHGLWSLWDMLAQYGWNFFVLSQLLERLHSDLGIPPPPIPTGGIGTATQNALVSLGSGIGGLGSNPLYLAPLPPPSLSGALTAEEAERCWKLLALLDSLCDEVEVNVSKDIKRASDYLKGSWVKRDESIFYIKNVTERVSDELHEQRFLHVKKEKVKFYRNLQTLDGPIPKKFPRATHDLYHAGNCFALEQFTACVFHLMRVMEHCVQRFGNKLKVQIDVKNETWYQILEHVNKAVKALPAGKSATYKQNKKRERYSLAADRLDHVRIVWRNQLCTQKKVMKRLKHRRFWQV